MNLYDVTADNAGGFTFTLDDGTVVDFVKVTSKDNIQVRLPADHDAADGDPLRIFRRDGSHYKDELLVTLSATPKSTPANDDDLTGKLVVIGQAVYTLTKVGDLLEAA